MASDTLVRFKHTRQVRCSIPLPWTWYRKFMNIWSKLQLNLKIYFWLSPKITATLINNLTDIMTHEVAGGNCTICCCSTCLFFLIHDLRDWKRECLSYFYSTHIATALHLVGYVYLFKMGLGICKGVGECVYFVANKISRLETSHCLFDLH